LFADDSIYVYLQDGFLNTKIFVQKKLNNEMKDSITNGIEGKIKYEFSLYLKNEGFTLFGDTLVEKKIITFNAKYELSSKKIFLYNESLVVELSSFDELENLIFQTNFDKIFELGKTGKYYVKFNFYFDTVKLFPPFSLILFFINIYNIKIENILSNIISYEN